MPAEDELGRLRAENEALSAVVSLVASSADLGCVLDRVVDLLSKVAGSHACFVYLVEGRTLRLRAASPVYARHVGAIAFDVDEGLAGWAVRHGEAAYIRDQADRDPRTNHVAELDEDRFQSIAAVPVHSRSGDPLGVIVSHTVAPHEFDEAIVNVLAHAASLIAGPIENAKLYDEARHRVQALERLSTLSQRIAAVESSAELTAATVSGVRGLLPCERCALLEVDGHGERPTRRSADDLGGPPALLDLVRDRAAGAPTPAHARALGHDPSIVHALAVPVAAGEELLGALVAGGSRPWPALGDEMLRAVAHQVAVAVKRIELIDALSGERAAHELMAALADAQWDRARFLAGRLGGDIDARHVVVVLGGGPGGRVTTVARAVRERWPTSWSDVSGDEVRAIVSAGSDLAGLAADVQEIAETHGVAARLSEECRDGASLRDGLLDAADAARVAAVLRPSGGVLTRRDMGAYRYLVHALDEPARRDRLCDAVRRVVDYDERRRTSLLDTFETYLEHGRSARASARALGIHVNTLRQRLERVEAEAGIQVGQESLLELHIAVKLVRLARA